MDWLLSPFPAIFYTVALISWCARWMNKKIQENDSTKPADGENNAAVPCTQPQTQPQLSGMEDGSREQPSNATTTPDAVGLQPPSASSSSSPRGTLQQQPHQPQHHRRRRSMMMVLWCSSFLPPTNHSGTRLLLISLMGWWAVPALLALTIAAAGLPFYQGGHVEDGGLFWVCSIPASSSSSSSVSYLPALLLFILPLGLAIVWTLGVVVWMLVQGSPTRTTNSQPPQDLAKVHKQQQQEAEQASKLKENEREDPPHDLDDRHVPVPSLCPSPNSNPPSDDDDHSKTNRDHLATGSAHNNNNTDIMRILSQSLSSSFRRSNAPPNNHELQHSIQAPLSPRQQRLRDRQQQQQQQQQLLVLRQHSLPVMPTTTLATAGVFPRGSNHTQSADNSSSSGLEHSHHFHTAAGSSSNLCHAPSGVGVVMGADPMAASGPPPHYPPAQEGQQQATNEEWFNDQGQQQARQERIRAFRRGSSIAVHELVTTVLPAVPAHQPPVVSGDDAPFPPHHQNNTEYYGYANPNTAPRTGGPSFSFVAARAPRRGSSVAARGTFVPSTPPLVLLAQSSSPPPPPPIHNQHQNPELATSPTTPPPCHRAEQPLSASSGLVRCNTSTEQYSRQHQCRQEEPPHIPFFSSNRVMVASCIGFLLSLTCSWTWIAVAQLVSMRTEEHDDDDDDNQNDNDYNRFALWVVVALLTPLHGFWNAVVVAYSWYQQYNLKSSVSGTMESVNAQHQQEEEHENHEGKEPTRAILSEQQTARHPTTSEGMLPNADLMAPFDAIASSLTRSRSNNRLRLWSWGAADSPPHHNPAVTRAAPGVYQVRSEHEGRNIGNFDTNAQDVLDVSSVTESFGDDEEYWGTTGGGFWGTTGGGFSSSATSTLVLQREDDDDEEAGTTSVDRNKSKDPNDSSSTMRSQEEDGLVSTQPETNHVVLQSPRRTSRRGVVTTGATSAEGGGETVLERRASLTLSWIEQMHHYSFKLRRQQQQQGLEAPSSPHDAPTTPCASRKNSMTSGFHDSTGTPKSFLQYQQQQQHHHNSYQTTTSGSHLSSSGNPGSRQTWSTPQTPTSFHSTPLPKTGGAAMMAMGVRTPPGGGRGPLRHWSLGSGRNATGSSSTLRRTSVPALGTPGLADRPNALLVRGGPSSLSSPHLMSPSSAVPITMTSEEPHEQHQEH